MSKVEILLYNDRSCNRGMEEVVVVGGALTLETTRSYVLGLYHWGSHVNDLKIGLGVNARLIST